MTTEAFSGLILGNPSRLSGPRSLRGGSYPFAGYPNFCYDWGARAYNESGRYIGKPAHMRSKPAQRVLLRHVVVHYTDGHTTSLGLPFAMGSGLKSDKPTVQYALTGKREYMATTPKTSSRLLRQMSNCPAWRDVVTHLRRKHQHVAWPAVAYVELNIKNFSISRNGPLAKQVASRLDDLDHDAVADGPQKKIAGAVRGEASGVYNYKSDLYSGKYKKRWRQLYRKELLSPNVDGVVALLCTHNAVSFVFRWSCYWQERQHRAHRRGLQARNHARGHHKRPPHNTALVEALAQQ